MKYYERIISKIADHAAKQIFRKTIRALQKLSGDSLQSSIDSGLKNVWDEICAQVQGDKSIHWEAYEDTINRFLQEHIQELSIGIKQSIWLQTQEGIDWSIEIDDDDNVHSQGSKDLSIPVNDDDIVVYIFREYVMREAANWENSRIREYLDKGIEFD